MRDAACDLRHKRQWLRAGKKIMVLFLINRLYFSRQFQVYSKIKQKVQEFPIHTSCPHMHTDYPNVNITLQSDIFVTTDKLHLHVTIYPKSIVYMRAHWWWCAFYGFRQIYSGTFHHYSVIQSIFTGLKILHAPPIHPPLPQPWQLLIFLSVPQFCLFMEYDIVGILQQVDFSNQFFF